MDIGGLSRMRGQELVQLPAGAGPKLRLHGCSSPSQNPESIPNNLLDMRLHKARKTCSAKCRK